MIPSVCCIGWESIRLPRYQSESSKRLIYQRRLQNVTRTSLWVSWNGISSSKCAWIRWVFGLQLTWMHANPPWRYQEALRSLISVCSHYTDLDYGGETILRRDRSEMVTMSNTNTTIILNAHRVLLNSGWIRITTSVRDKARGLWKLNLYPLKVLVDTSKRGCGIHNLTHYLEQRDGCH